MKRLFALILALLLGTSSLWADEGEANAVPSVLYSTTFYFEKGQGRYIEPYEYVKAIRLRRFVRENSDVFFEIRGWCDPSGGVDLNARLSEKRAATLARYLTQHGVDPNRITHQGCGIDFHVDSVLARRAEVVAYIFVEIEEEEPLVVSEVVEQLSEVQEEVKEDPKVEPAPPAPTPVVPPIPFTIRTDLLYWLGGLMNLGVEYKSEQSSIGLVLNGGYSPFGHTTWNHNLGGWYLAPEIRYYLPAHKGWFVGAQGLAAGFNYKLTETGYQGSALGGGVSGGYKMRLSQRFDADFTLGVGYGHLSYDTYYHVSESEINYYIDKGMTAGIVFPVQLGINLIWRIK